MPVLPYVSSVTIKDALQAFVEEARIKVQTIGADCRGLCSPIDKQATAQAIHAVNHPGLSRCVSSLRNTLL